MNRSATRILFLPLIVISFFPACSEKPKNPVAEYGDALLNAHSRAKDAAGQADIDALQKTVQAYQASNGKFPESLKDIEGIMGSSIDTAKFDYDPRTGVVRLKTQ